MPKKPNEEVNAIGKLTARPIVQEMEESYLSYAMSVIVSRALPDVRDGLKPVQRRILYSMWKLGLKHNVKFKKSATVVGEVMGKYHPHGDSAIYETMVRMAQDFSLRDPLINGQGNFGSMDGDGAAAMRYTEAKLEAISEEMLFDIEKDTVDWVDNYDGTRKEPSFLPAKLPQLLLNGTMGIAVGMATNIPPHNLEELIDGITYLIDNKDASVEDLAKFIKGPDFPTAGIIYNQKDILEAYQTGKGGIVTRAKADIIENDRGMFSIIITELTYQTNKSNLIKKLADLVKDGKIQGIKDIRDESDRDGVRVVIDLKKDGFPKKVLNTLYKVTELQKTFHLNMLALVNGIEPRILNLKAILEEYVAHRQNVVTRRIQFELNKAKERAHILEGLKIALDHIDAVIKTIRGSQTKELAHKNLRKKFKLSERQADAILEMKLQTLAGLERKKIEDELKEKMKFIKKMEAILKSPKKIAKIVKDELIALRAKFGSPRRTRVIKGSINSFSQEDLIANEETIISFTEDGYIKRLPTDTFRTQKRGGRGVTGGNIKEGDAVDKVLGAMTHDDLFFFTNTGKVFCIKAYELPSTSRTAKGQSIVNFLQVESDEKITSILAIPKDSDAEFMVMQTAKGKIKKTALQDFAKVRQSGLIAIKLAKGDTLNWVHTTSGKDSILITTANGQAIHFNETQVRAMGRTAGGVNAIRLKKDDFVVGMCTVKKSYKSPQLLVITENGYSKKTPVNKYKKQTRSGSGLKTLKVTPKVGNLVSSRIIEADDKESTLVASSNKGQIIRTSVNAISVLGRATQGVRIMNLKAGEKVSAVTVL
jgi:DNA gyrase subunit A